MMGKEEVKEPGTVVAIGRQIARETSELAYIWDRKRARKSECATRL